jgi:hypothetical protein
MDCDEAEGQRVPRPSRRGRAGRGSRRHNGWTGAFIAPLLKRLVLVLARRSEVDQFDAVTVVGVDVALGDRDPLRPPS